MNKSKIISLQENMAEKQKLLEGIDKKIERTKELIEETKERKLSTLAFENQLSQFLSGRNTIQKEWDKLRAQVKELTNG